MSEKISNLDSGIRIVQLVRRVGSIAVVTVIFLLLASSLYHELNYRFSIDELQELKDNGISQIANVNNEYKTTYINGQSRSTLTYNFEYNGERYEGEYTLYGGLPKNIGKHIKIFTVHFLKDDPDTNSLNLENEIIRVQKEIEEYSVFWLIIKILGLILTAFILLSQLLSFYTEIKHLQKPIETPDDLKK